MRSAMMAAPCYCPRERLHAVLFRQHTATRASRERIRDHAVNGLLQRDGDVAVAVSRYRRLDARIVVDHDVRRCRRLPVAATARGNAEIVVGASRQRHVLEEQCLWEASRQLAANRPRGWKGSDPS